MFIVMIWFKEPDDFCHYGPFATYEEALVFLNAKIPTLAESVRSDVFKIINPSE